MANGDKPVRKRIKLPKFEKPTADALSKLVEEGKLRKVDVPAREAKKSEKTGKMRKAIPARTEYLAENRAAGLALYGGNEKAFLLGASLYAPTYWKRMDAKGKVADPFRALNRLAEQYAKMDPEVIASLPAEMQEQIKSTLALAKANPRAPRARKSKDKTETK